MTCLSCCIAWNCHVRQHVVVGNEMQVVVVMTDAHRRQRIIDVVVRIHAV